jgi:cobalt-zinc-cadmium efflux system membrane fusion protein
MLANAPQFFAPLFTVSDPSKLWVLIDATEADMPRLTAGQPITARSRAFPDATFTGQVEVVSGFLDPQTRTAKVRGWIDNSSGQLRAEMFVNVELPTPAQAQATVPARSVFLKGQRHFAYVEEAPGRFVRREVSIGREEGDRLLVSNGLKPGELVVTDGCLLLEQLRD